MDPGVARARARSGEVRAYKTCRDSQGVKAQEDVVELSLTGQQPLRPCVAVGLIDMALDTPIGPRSVAWRQLPQLHGPCQTGHHLHGPGRSGGSCRLRTYRRICHDRHSGRRPHHH